MKDEKIIELFLLRDGRALEEVDKKYGDLIYYIASNFLALREDREECVNDVYLALWNAIPPTEPKSLSAFLAKIVRTLALERSRKENAWKRGGRVQTVGEEFLQGVTDGRTLADDYESSRAGKIINEFLDSQPKADRKIFVLRYWFDEDISRIALRTGYSESRIKSLLKRQRDKLRAMLEKEGITV